MADEKEFDNLVAKAGVKALHTKEPYQKICGLLGIAYATKESKVGLKNLIIASNVSNPTRDFAEVLTRMPASEPKARATKKSALVVVHAGVHDHAPAGAGDGAGDGAGVDGDVKVADEEKTSSELIAYPLCDASLLNRETLSGQIHIIHNFLRNRGVGYGMSALKVFNLFYGLARIEQFDLFAMIGLDTSCKFSELVSIAKQTLSSTAGSSNNAIYELTDQYQDKINAIQMTRKFMMSELPDNISNGTIARLVIDIDKLIQSEIQIGEQICGKVYEYFIGRDQTAISELGAYFTNRSITQFIYEQLAPELDAEGKVQSMIDPFGGSGGFTTGYVMNMCARFPEIDWKDGISQVYHFDMNNDVVRYAALELMCLTRALPNMCDNMICENSFATERFTKYKYVCTNPPYGGDNITESTSQKTRKILKEKLAAEIAQLKMGGNTERLKRRELQLAKIDADIKAEDIENDKQKVKTDSPSTSMFIRNYAREHNLFATESRSSRQVLFGNDKEATSLILIAALVAPGGTAVGVLKEGVFFNNKYAILRKHLVEKFNVRKVISIPSDQFENTTTKTSIIIFDNDPEKKTSRIDFSELKVTTYEQDEFGEDSSGNLVVIGARGAFREVHEHPVSSASLVELQKMVGAKQPFSLDGKQYSLRILLAAPGYKMVKLGDLCEFMQKEFRAATFANENGKYRFYTSGQSIKRCECADIRKLSLIIGHSGDGSIFLDDEYSCLSTSHILTNNDPIMLQYIYYILLGLREDFHSRSYQGSTVKNTSDTSILAYRIPVAENNAKIAEWVAKISRVYDERLAIEATIGELDAEIHSIIHTVCESGAFTEHKLSEMLIKKGTGSMLSNSTLAIGTYPMYSAVAKNPIGMNNSFDYDCDDYLLFATSGGSSKTICGDTLGIGKFWRVSGKISCTGHVSIYEFAQSINRDWIVHYLSFALYDIQRLANYSTGLGGIKSDVIGSFPIKLATDDTILKKVDELSSQRTNARTEYVRADITFKKLIEELTHEAIVQDTPIVSVPSA